MFALLLAENAITMTDLCYIVLTYWDLLKPTYSAIKKTLKEDISKKYATIFQRRQSFFDYEPAK